MNNLNDLFGPLRKEYCYYFYALSLFGLISLVLLVLSSLILVVSGKYSAGFNMQMFVAVVAYGMLYLQNRLLFNMCKGV